MGKRSGSSSTKRKPPISIQDLRKSLHVIPAKNHSEPSKSDEENTQTLTNRFDKAVEKDQKGYCNVPSPTTINVGNEATKGTAEDLNATEVVGEDVHDASVVDYPRSKPKSPATSSISRRTEALRGTYIPSVDTSTILRKKGDEGKGEYNDEYSEDALDREDEDNRDDPLDDELDDIKKGYEISKREVELLRTCSELNKIIDDLRRSKENTKEDMRTKSAGFTPFRRSEILPNSNRRRFHQRRSYSPNRGNPNLQWRPIVQNYESDPERGQRTKPNVFAEGCTAASVNHAQTQHHKDPNGNMHTSPASSTTQVTATSPAVPTIADVKGTATTAEPDGKRVWADLLKQNNIPNFQLEYIRPESIDNIVDIPDCVISDGVRDWDTTLVGYFLGRKLPYTLVSNSAHRMWDKFGLYEILATDTGYFFFKFNDKSQSEAILEGGPWHFAGQPIIMKSWSPGLTLSKESQNTVPVWVNFFYLPMELWGPEGLSRVASAIGKPLQVDRMTATKRRISYARVCIEMSAENDPIDELTVQFNNPKTGKREAVNVRIQYQWTPVRCVKCKTFGHNCEKKLQDPKTNPMAVKKGPTNDGWMVRKKGKEVAETSAPILSHQVHDTNHISSFSSQVEANPLAHQTEIQQLDSAQPKDPCRSAGVAPVAAQTITNPSQQQVPPYKQPHDPKRSKGKALGNTKAVGEMVQHSNKFSALNDIPDDEVTNEEGQGQAQDPPDNANVVTNEGRNGPQMDTSMQLSHSKLNRSVESPPISFNDF